MATPAPAVVSRRLLLTGRVQGVGFRPFVYRLAHELRLDGFVRNLRGDVEVVLHGPAPVIERFTREVVTRAPPLARPVVAEVAHAEHAAAPGFTIEPSSAALQPQISVPPDFFCCPECLAEMATPGDRRYRYAFINCTQCGPRYTLIEALPYDRPNTSMRAFPLCPACSREYQDPLDRRFHAEPVACPACGPHLTFVVGAGDDGTRRNRPGPGDDAALAAAVEVLRAGAVLAVKGVGGYHLLCDARSAGAVARLRTRKQRPDKPLAVMYPWQGTDGLDAVRQDFTPEPAALESLLDPARPIVLLRAAVATKLRWLLPWPSCARVASSPSRASAAIT
jgi:hydrogenase maturation protein HypF